MDSDVRLDTELADLPSEMRWREWMGRIEAVLFAAHEPPPRAMLACLVGRDCPLDALIADIRAELRGRPYDLVKVGDSYAFRTRPAYGAALRAAFVIDPEAPHLSKLEAAVLAAIAYEQPISRAELSERFGREISRDLIAALRDKALIAAGPRKPQPGAPFAYVTTARFLETFGLETLADLPDFKALQHAGLADDLKPLEV
jgi:segregation and condensation protein B